MIFINIQIVTVTYNLQLFKCETLYYLVKPIFSNIRLEPFSQVCLHCIQRFLNSIMYNQVCHIAWDSINVIRAAFSNQIISRFCDAPCPPWSPNLSICKFHFWGYSKSSVCESKSRSLENGSLTRDQIEEIDEETLKRVEAKSLENESKCMFIFMLLFFFVYKKLMASWIFK